MRVSKRVYEALLQAYRKEFREGYGPRMVQAFEDLCCVEQRLGRVFGLVKLWARTFLDLATTALVARSSGHANNKEAIMKDYKLAAVGFALLLAPL